MSAKNQYQDDLFSLQPPRFEIPGAWWSTVKARWYVGAHCTDLSWPVWKK